MDLFRSLETNALATPGRTAIVSGHSRISYGDLLERVGRLANALSRMGLEKGDRVALLTHNCPEFIIAFYASMKLGLITVSLNVMFKQEEVEYILGDADPGLLIAHTDYAPVLTGIDRVRDGSLRLLWLGPMDKAAGSPAPSFREVLEASPSGQPETTPVEPTDPAVIAYTSGTTGFPKGAVHTHENILVHLGGIRKQLQFTGDDVFLAALPFFQLVAFLIHPVMAFHAGATVVILAKFEPGAFLQAVTQERVTFFAAVPTIYQMLYTAEEKMQVDLGTVRFGICAGAPLSLKLREQFENRFRFRIIHCYGMTEISLIASCEDPLVQPKSVSVGEVLPYIRLQVVDEKGTPVAPGEVGEIRIGQERSLSHYWNNATASADALADGWFATGDMGSFDDEGHLYIVDRKKDMIIRGGFNVYPAEIERVLLQHPGISEAVVIGIPHARLGEVPRAYVVLHPGEALSPEAVLEFSRTKLANYKALEEVHFVAPQFFPRNALGKIIKPQIRRRLAEEGA